MRIRTIKPEFYQSEELGKVPREARLLAAALITWADDEGYFKSHPALIAGSLFPFDRDGQKFVKDGLELLSSAGFVELGSGGIGRLPTFSSHQVINRLTPSKLKESFDPLSPHGVLTESSLLEGNGREVEGKGTGNRECGPIGGSEVFALITQEPPDPVAELRAVWNEVTTKPIPRWESGRDTEAKKALRRRPLEQWREVFGRINASTFCRGEDGGWVATVDWALRADGKKPETALKVLEGSYDNRAGPPKDLTRGVARSEDFEDQHVVGIIDTRRKAAP